jgi:subtilisin-like proprotein convertase family protein
VIVESGNSDLLKAVVQDFGGGVIQPLPVDNFWLVSTGTVASAISMTSALLPLYPEGAVYLDLQRPLTFKALPNDQYFSNQWHLRNTSNTQADANVEPAWNNGYTGTGVIVGVIDGGSQNNHPDLQGNYNSTASSTSSSSSHGTSVAGVIAAVANNNRGVVGAAYDAQWSRHTYGSSSNTANAFKHRNDLNDIKNNSWGPYDDGTVTYLSSVELSALEESVTTGRGGLGEIFTWAAGNGGTADRSDYDPYASSRYTIAVGAIGDNDTRAYYNEKGSSMMVVAQSSGNSRSIWTTDSGSGYTSSFGGTSSAAPLGAGVIALVLDANPGLTWRDVQHVVIKSARKCAPNNSDWKINGGGLDINYNYGFGAMDADAACNLAAGWANVGPELELRTGSVSVGQSIPDNNDAGVDRIVSVPNDISVENVELRLKATHNSIGHLRVELISPSGTKSVLAATRNDSQNNYNNYVFTTVRHWDERSNGDWTIHVSDRTSGTTGTWDNFELRIYGHDGQGGGQGMSLTSSALIPGVTAIVNLADATASAPAWLAYSLAGLGSTPIGALGVTLDLASPQQAGSVLTVDANGDGSWSLPIPGGSSGVSVWLQALQMGEVSDVVATSIL